MTWVATLASLLPGHPFLAWQGPFGAPTPPAAKRVAPRLNLLSRACPPCQRSCRPACRVGAAHLGDEKTETEIRYTRVFKAQMIRRMLGPQDLTASALELEAGAS